MEAGRSERGSRPRERTKTRGLVFRNGLHRGLERKCAYASGGTLVIIRAPGQSWLGWFGGPRPCEPRSDQRGPTPSSPLGPHKIHFSWQ